MKTTVAGNWRRRPYRLGMRPERVHSCAESRNDYVAPARRRVKLARAAVLEGDPPWLHQGLTLRLKLAGEPVDFFGISIMSHALGRSHETVRRLLRQGVLPAARCRTAGRGRYGQKRRWTRSQVLAAAAAMAQLGLRDVRPRTWQEVGAVLAVVATA